MRIFAILLPLLVVIPQPAAGSVDKQEQEATVVFWNLATCIVERNPDAVRKLLAKPNWQVEDQSSAKSMAQNSLDQYPLREEPCGLFESLGFKSDLLKGALAGAMFVRDTKSGVFPDYSTIHSPVTAADLASAKDETTQFQLGLRAFSYCVFLNRPSDVRALLATRPFSQTERGIFDTLATTFGGCMPAKEGARISFTRVKLRSLLGEAAYYADASLSSRSPTGKSN